MCVCVCVSRYFVGNIILKHAGAHLFAHSQIVSSTANTDNSKRFEVLLSNTNNVI